MPDQPTESVLQSMFVFFSFRSGQWEVIERTAQGAARAER